MTKRRLSSEAFPQAPLGGKGQPHRVEFPVEPEEIPFGPAQLRAAAVQSVVITASIRNNAKPAVSGGAVHGVGGPRRYAIAIAV